MLGCESLIKAIDESFSGEERGLQVAFESREQSIGTFIRSYCLLAVLILALLSVGSLSPSQQAHPQEVVQSSSPELLLGIALARKGDFKKAEAAFEQAVALHPQDPRTLT